VNVYLTNCAATELAAKGALFSDALSKTSPGDIQDNVDGLQSLIDKGEASREMALHNQSVAQGIYDDAFGVWQTAFDEEQVALGNQKEAEEDEAEAVIARDNAIAFKNKRIEEKAAADNAVPPAEAWMNSEIERVDEEKASLEKVQAILDDLLANGGKAAVEISHARNLLSRSRTAAFLSNPAFLSSLNSADPAALQQVLDIVLNLLQEGEDDRQSAIQAYNDRVSEAATAAQNLVDAETALATREEELVAAGEHTAAMTEIAVGKTAVEVEKRKIRDAKKKKLDVQIDFTNREIARIDGEREILLNDISLTGQLKQIAELLA